MTSNRILVAWKRRDPEAPHALAEYTHSYFDRERAASDIADLMANPDITTLAMLCGQGLPEEPGEDTVRQLLPDAPDFFKADTLYVRKLLYTAPEHREEFQCVSVDTDPNTGGLMAFGWSREGCEGTFGPAACSQEIWEKGWMVQPETES